MFQENLKEARADVSRNEAEQATIGMQKNIMKILVALLDSLKPIFWS